MIRALVFDLFDTLVDLRWARVPRAVHAGRELPAALWQMHARIAQCVELDFGAFLEAMESNRRAYSDSHLAQDREVPTELLMRHLLARFELSNEALVEELTAIHMDGIRAGVVALDHHRQVLDTLGRDRPLGLCSNFTHSPTALSVLEEAGLLDALRPEALVVSDAVGWRKPHPLIFEAVAEALGVEPCEMLHVGDSLRADVVGAAAVGARTAWITRCVEEPDFALAEHSGHTPDHVIADLAELPALVAELG